MQVTFRIPLWENPKNGSISSTFVFMGQQYTAYLNKNDSGNEKAPVYHIDIKSYEPKKTT